MDKIGLNVTSIRLPKKPLLPELVEQLVNACHTISQLKNKPSSNAVQSRYLHCHTLIEGLYQTWCCQSPNARLNVFLSPQYYHSTEFGKINHLSQHYLNEAVTAIQHMGWSDVIAGWKSKSGNIPTQLHAIGDLEKCFQETSLRWTPLEVPKDCVVLRGYDKDSKERFPLKVRQTALARRMNVNVRKINEHISKQAICLHLSNVNLKALIKRMSTPKYRSHWHQTEPEKHGRLLNFNHVNLKRVFSRGSMERGGRFYGGWWQFIPSEYREFITINGIASVEIDYSELHPRLLYLEQGLAPPTGDLYDIGLVIDGKSYDPSSEPYKTQRDIVKEVFNALLNDESGRYRMDEEQVKTIGIKQSELKKRLIKRHPPLKSVLGKGVGLGFQYIDSQVAEVVMLDLLKQGVTCLPVHDSFIVPRHQGQLLHAAMLKAFTAVMKGNVAKLKPPSNYKSDFLMTFLPNGELDRDAMFRMHADAVHNHFLQSRFQALSR
jgi:hypothetical protein